MYYSKIMKKNIRKKLIRFTSNKNIYIYIYKLRKSQKFAHIYAIKYSKQNSVSAENHP